MPNAKSRAVPRGKQLRRSMSLVTLAWVFGSVWVTATSGAPLTLFAKGLGLSNFQFGVLSALPFIASLASMPASVWIDRTGALKPIFIYSLLFMRILWVPIALVPLWLIHHNVPAVVYVFLFLVLLMNLGQAVGGPAWVSWMSKLVPDGIRGSYFSRRRQWGILSAIPAAVVVGWMLDRLKSSGGNSVSAQTMGWCSLIFVCAAVFGLMDIILFFWVPAVHAKPKAPEPVFAQLRRPLKDRQFLLFGGFVGTMTFAVSFMGQFLTLYLLEKLHVNSIQTQLMLLVAPMLAQLFVLRIWGIMCDRMGKKPVMVIASLGLVPVGLGWCLMNSGAVWLGYLLSALGGALWCGIEVANFNFVAEFAVVGDSKTGGSSYVATNSVIINLAGCFGGLSAGLIAKLMADWSWDPHILGLSPFTFYEVLFLLSGLMRLAAVVFFLPALHEPTARPTRDALRFMAGNIYNNVFNAILLPLRFIERDRGRPIS